MEIRLDNEEWFFNGYRINGDCEDGYNVYSEFDDEILFTSNNFENCLTWCLNS